ncbi:MAG: NAD-dependent epimerase [Saprospiraceae bacterium]|nr:NAD-dependent epimerase [Saprospiraceae bacterium]
MKILITGSAGFIGFHLANRLAAEGHEVVGLDNLNNYYDVKLKLNRLENAGIDGQKVAYNEPVRSNLHPNYEFIQLNIEDAANLERLFVKKNFDMVCHLAAQAGVRYSLKNPDAYIQSNIVGFFNILEACRHHQIKHLVYASSSSVYGLNEKMPYSTSDNVDHPISLYAATKKSNELMAHTYSHLFKLPTTGLRFFTVYGPWGRPDMSYSLFVKSILEGKPIQIFNQGQMSRDFTYVDDVVEGITRVLERPASGNASWSGQSPDPSTSFAPYQIYNIGNNSPVALMDMIAAIEEALGITAIKEFMPMQAGDVVSTFADTQRLEDDFGFKPTTTLKQGVQSFVTWFLSRQANEKVLEPFA